jgi:hypothetical protein
VRTIFKIVTVFKKVSTKLFSLKKQFKELMEFMSLNSSLL